MVHFLVGLVLGGCLGFVIAALFSAAKDDRCEEMEGEE